MAEYPFEAFPFGGDPFDAFEVCDACGCDYLPDAANYNAYLCRHCAAAEWDQML